MRLTLLVALILSVGTCAAQAPQRSTYRWTQFVNVDGQPEPVPAEWVSTPEGKFAHSIKIPNPVPKDGGYRRGMSGEEYFEHLCKTEAGEFIFKTVEKVEGFYFMRPPKRPSDDDLMARYVLEDPYTERLYQLLVERSDHRPTQFINPPFNNYTYVEEPRRNVAWQRSIQTPYLRMFGYRYDGKLGKVVSQMTIEEVSAPKSQYAYTWRGIRRPSDRENGIAGSELIIVDLSTAEVAGVLRNFVISGRTRKTNEGIWWLNARSCPQFPVSYRDSVGKQMYEFVSKVLMPNRP